MKITAVKTRLIRAGEYTIEEILKESINELKDNSVIAVSSKIIALCENRIASSSITTKSELVKRESDYYTPEEFNVYGFSFAIVHNTFIPSAGIDESNANGDFVLWPEDPQQSANIIREFLCSQFGVKNIGVIVTDSTCMPPMRAGTIGIMIAHSGFNAVKKLIGTQDLFGRTYEVSQSAIGGGLAAAANVLMGEGAEQTPLAVIEGIPFVEFQHHNPTNEELSKIYIDPAIDLYAPFIQSAPWKKGERLSKA